MFRQRSFTIISGKIIVCIPTIGALSPNPCKFPPKRTWSLVTHVAAFHYSMEKILLCKTKTPSIEIHHGLNTQKISLCPQWKNIYPWHVLSFGQPLNPVWIRTQQIHHLLAVHSGLATMWQYGNQGYQKSRAFLRGMLPYWPYAAV